MMANEKPGGHGERSVAVGTTDTAVWDAVAKIGDGVEVRDGYITMPELPGIGFEGKTDLYREMRALR